MLIDVSVTMINDVFLPPGIKEYINDVSYASKARTLIQHAGTHPPDAVLTLWLATRLFSY